MEHTIIDVPLDQHIAYTTPVDHASMSTSFLNYILVQHIQKYIFHINN